MVHKGQLYHVLQSRRLSLRLLCWKNVLTGDAGAIGGRPIAIKWLGAATGSVGECLVPSKRLLWVPVVSTGA